MREIKFKAKRVDNGEWVSGDLIHYKKEFKKRVAIVDWNEDNDGHREVHPETVCQYTGLKDKNGKEIWEGDMYEVAKNNKYEVKWLSGGESNFEWFGGCFVLFLNEDLFFPFDEYSMEHGEVIGNIHDKETTDE